MENQIDYDFIAVPKVVNHKIGLNASTILATLIYKQKYWKDENKMTTSGTFTGFYISYPDIQEETCLGLNAIKNGIKTLKSEGLIKTKQQGLGQPNLYSIDELKLSNYISDNKQEYEDWRLQTRDKKRSGRPVSVKKDENHLSGNAKNSFQESSISSTTKNKITNNKKLKTITNRTSTELDFFEFEESLGGKIELLKAANYTNLDNSCKELYRFLCEQIKGFEKFEASDEDMEYLEDISSYNLDSFGIASKITQNVRAIYNGSKKPRFGNLFVGLNHIAENTELKHTG